MINSLRIDADPDTVYAFMLDVNRVVQCLPGAQLSKVVDPNTFEGQIKIKVGPITVAYNGLARITDRDDANRSAKLSGEGRETTGSGSARATVLMSVKQVDSSSEVTLVTDLNVAGRVAQFGRGIMEDVSRRLVADMAGRMKAQLEAGPEGADHSPQDEGAGSVNAVSLLGGVVKDRIMRRFGGQEDKQQ